MIRCYCCQNKVCFIQPILISLEERSQSKKSENLQTNHDHNNLRENKNGREADRGRRCREKRETLEQLEMRRGSKQRQTSIKMDKYLFKSLSLLRVVTVFEGLDVFLFPGMRQTN